MDAWKETGTKLSGDCLFIDTLYYDGVLDQVCYQLGQRTIGDCYVVMHIYE